VPELPEVETVRAGLEPLVSGASIDAVTIYRASCVRRHGGGAPEFGLALADAGIGEVVRRGKYLWFLLEEGPGRPAQALSAHLGMSGQFRSFEGSAPTPHAHCRARFSLTTPRGPLTLDFLDQRTFGYLHVESLVPTADGAPGGQGSAVTAVPRSVAHIARDALDPAADRAGAVNAMRKGMRPIKTVLLDQTVVSGIGNIYADEALWLARVHPLRTASSLTSSEATRVLTSVRGVMERALAQGGTSFDALYVNVNGESGYFSRDLTAYGRAGEPCFRCGDLLMRDRVAGRSTHWCPRCQTGPQPGTDRD